MCPLGNAFEFYSFLSCASLILESYADGVNIFVCLCVGFIQPSNKLTVFH